MSGDGGHVTGLHEVVTAAVDVGQLADRQGAIVGGDARAVDTAGVDGAHVSGPAGPLGLGLLQAQRLQVRAIGGDVDRAPGVASHEVNRGGVSQLGDHDKFALAHQFGPVHIYRTLIHEDDHAARSQLFDDFVDGVEVRHN